MASKSAARRSASSCTNLGLAKKSAKPWVGFAIALVLGEAAPVVTRQDAMQIVGSSAEHLVAVDDGAQHRVSLRGQGGEPLRDDPDNLGLLPATLTRRD
jgi:hypothetical protein